MTPSPAASRRPSALLGVAVALVLVIGVAVWIVSRQSTVDTVTPSESSVDVGFLRDMADHHDQAVQLALIQLANTEDRVLEGFAVDTLASQRYEIGLMDARLQDWGVERGAVDRKAMKWMDAPTAVRSMPGMASTDELTELTRLRGVDGDLLFIRLMTEHHLGGIHMATHAMRHAGNPRVRELAERIAKQQRLEIRDLELARSRIERGGSAPSAPDHDEH